MHSESVIAQLSTNRKVPRPMGSDVSALSVRSAKQSADLSGVIRRENKKEILTPSLLLTGSYLNLKQQSVRLSLRDSCTSQKNLARFPFHEVCYEVSEWHV